MDEEREAVRNFPKNDEALNLPEEPGFCFDLTALPDPPGDFTFLGRRYDDVWNERSFKAAPTKLLGRLHFWGIYFTDRFTPTKTIILLALWKLMYHMPERTRPKTATELYSLDRDTGPRLLGWEHHDPNVGPISRFHRIRPTPGQGTAPGYVRPGGVPSSVTDVEVERYLLPVERAVVQPSQPTQPPRRRRRPVKSADAALLRAFSTVPTDLYEGVDDVPTDPHEGVNEAPTDLVAPTDLHKRVNEAPIDLYEGVNEVSIDLYEGVDDVPTSPMKGPPVYTPRGLSPVIPSESLPDYQQVTEELEKLIYRYTYRHLERAHFAPQRTPRSKRIAQSIDDLETVQIGTHSAHSHLRLNPVTFELDKNSTHLYPYRGRGPIWSGNSCSVDCVIVLGMLLDIGCTNIDRESWRWKQITDLEKAFIEITNVNWDGLTISQNIQMRDLFRKKLCAEVPMMDMISPQPAWAIWSECTKNIEQFYFKYSDFYKSCACANQQFVEGNKFANCVLPSIDYTDAEGIWLSDLVERVIYNKRLSPCIHCGAETDVWETRVEQLPPRMVISNYMGRRIRVYNHTEDVRFRYIDEFGTEKVAAYRWLGGIYHKDAHVRVFWSDQERGDQLRTNIRMYDDELNAGVIAGGIPPEHINDRVPYDWTNIGFLIGVYERIINPAFDMLNKATESLRRMEMAIDAGKAIMDKHHPWAQEFGLSFHNDPNTEQLNPSDESRVIPITAERFRDVSLIQLPASVPRPQDVNNFQFDDLQTLLTAWPPEDQVMDEAPPQYENLFDSMLNSPSRLANFPELWPNGVPNENGGLGFPNLPRSNSSKGSKDSNQAKTPVMDYVHWPSSSSSNGSREARGRNQWGKPTAGIRGIRKVPRPDTRLSVTRERRPSREARRIITRQERASIIPERFPKQESVEKDVKPKIKTENGSQEEVKAPSEDKAPSKDKVSSKHKVISKDAGSSKAKEKKSRKSRRPIPANPADSSSSNPRKRQIIGEKSTTKPSGHTAKMTSNPKGLHAGARTRYLVGKSTIGVLSREELSKLDRKTLSSFDRARLRSSPRDIIMPDAPPSENPSAEALSRVRAALSERMSKKKDVEDAIMLSEEGEEIDDLEPGDFEDEYIEDEEEEEEIDDTEVLRSSKVDKQKSKPASEQPSGKPAIPMIGTRIDKQTGQVIKAPSGEPGISTMGAPKIDRETGMVISALPPVPASILSKSILRSINRK
ncbi:uncharacterized protein N7483_004894 [Penicillium malachiteum]|uniref:uncharacterized protein n=1 Tax=Penicillium malachiteum TaxID=1324776 RepID=UPI002549614D|nr:uncharacterized protein N7483_004894 [Penicillium malachiteum]KAJ5730386.1 hypothetical protein N7483_004894 [Penicillium malachiteum]